MEPNPVIRKRKRTGQAKEPLSNPESVVQSNDAAQQSKAVATNPTKLEDRSQKAKRKRNTKKKFLEGDDEDSTAPEESAIPWPDYFKSLERLHKAWNTTYTFFCTRKHLATTFDNMKILVSRSLGREPTIEEVAQLAYLMHKSIDFRYVDEAELDINSASFESRGAGRPAGDPFLLRETHYQDDPQSGEQVLLFEYLDGDLKRQVHDSKTGQITAPKARLRNDKLKMPVFSQSQMMRLIEKRNVKFKSAINKLLNESVAQGREPVQKLLNEYFEYVPVPEQKQVPIPGPVRSLIPSSIPAERDSIPEIVDQIKTLEWYTGQIVPDGHRVFQAKEAVYGDLNFTLSQNLINALYHQKHVERFYSHQAEAINNLYDGHNVIVSTSTSSGKSLIYQIPVLHELEKDHNTRAMYIFPTKALAQDQRRSLKELLQFIPGLEDILVETFDGDTPMTERNGIRDDARIIFTNPDMLHITILPQEESWRTFLQNLKFVVVDELHVYNGLFGSHVALVMRRLRRICAAVGNRHVRFISCSATVANPEVHMKTIFGLENVKLTDVDGSPSGRKEFICWNTPYKDPKDPTSGRGNSLAEAAKLFCQLILRGVRVIAFARIRQSCESLISEVKKELSNLERGEVIERVMSYRGGYTPQDRRMIEKEMFEGKLMGIVATTALELGIDIGSLDAVISVGFPYTIANLRQQSGRAGRRNKDSVSILLGDSFPTDQYFMSNPDELFSRPNCELQVDLDNMLVLEGHLQCAAHEMPVRPTEDEQYFGPLVQAVAEELMRKDQAGFYHCSQRFLPHPARQVTIRDTEETHFAIIDITNGKNTILEDLEASRAFFTVYEGGIFLHQGLSYLVREFNQDKLMAKVERVNVSWTTQQRDYTDVDPVETEIIRKIPESASRAFMGPICVKQVVYGFFKMDARRRILDAVQVDNDPIILYRRGFWLDVPKSALEILVARRLNVAAAIHAAEHAILSLMPNFVISMPGDVRTECKVSLKEFAKRESSRKRPARLTFFDSKGGRMGSGISARAFEHVDLLLKQAASRITECHCLDGCLECCCSERCKDQNQVISKAGAEVIIKRLLEWEIDVDALPMGPEENSPAGIETVIPAAEVRPVRGKTREEIEIHED